MTAKNRPLFEQYLVQEPIFWPILKRLLGFVSYLCVVVCGFLAIAANDAARNPSRTEGIGGPLGLLLLITASVAGLGIFWALGKRFRARSGIATLRRTRIPPLLYLRPFGADAHWLDHWIESYEQSLAKAVYSYGPLVAIGKPGEILPPLGAARIYVDSAHWQQVVEDLAARSRLIILRAGRTEGFWWEVKHVVATTYPQRVVVYLPPKDRRETYSYLRSQAIGILPFPLPEFTGDAYFLGFGPQWEPRLFGTDPSIVNMLRRLLNGSAAPVVREAINPAMAAIGIEPRSLPLQFREWLLVLFAMMLILVVWAYSFLSMY